MQEPSKYELESTFWEKQMEGFGDIPPVNGLIEKIVQIEERILKSVLIRHLGRYPKKEDNISTESRIGETSKYDLLVQGVCIGKVERGFPGISSGEWYHDKVSNNTFRIVFTPNENWLKPNPNGKE